MHSSNLLSVSASIAAALVSIPSRLASTYEARNLRANLNDHVVIPADVDLGVRHTPLRRGDVGRVPGELLVVRSDVCGFMSLKLRKLSLELVDVRPFRHHEPDDNPEGRDRDEQRRR